MVSGICATLCSGRQSWVSAAVKSKVNADGLVDLNVKKGVPAAFVRLPDQPGIPTMTSAAVSVEGTSAQ